MTNTHLRHFWEKITSSYWFLPSLMLVGAMGLSFATLAIDDQLEQKLVEKIGWLYSGSAEGARELLGTVAGSMITVAGVVFSITIVALSLASSQFGPRLLRNFMRDTGNQVVLGMFVATFIYCLMILRTVRGQDGAEFVPYLSVSVGIALAIASIGVLIYHIHHIAASIQAEHVIAVVGRDLDKEIERLMPVEKDENNQWSFDEAEAFDPPTEAPADIVSDASGYVQAIDHDQLFDDAVKHDLLIEVRLRAGDFTSRGRRIARVWPADRVSDDLRRSIRQTMIVDAQRTPTQDIEYAIHQLVEIGVRALSPGVNDPYTAIACVDWLGDAVGRIGQRRFPDRIRRDDGGARRLVLDLPDFRGIVDAAFNLMRQYSSDSVSVMIRLLETLAVLAEQSMPDAAKSHLLRHVRMIQRMGRDLPEPDDREDVQRRCDECFKLLDAVPAGASSGDAGPLGN